ncbi:MAG: hypothetical protein CM1200mP41_11690 [Gammaproteobacteria bacterium]|nr:MAG: hypothetical protein CM1200mP41_11690 [Gammaproteobacteria bacterium]
MISIQLLRLIDWMSLASNSIREGKTVSELGRHEGAKVIAAAQPIWAEDKIIGSVLSNKAGIGWSLKKHATLVDSSFSSWCVFVLAIAIGCSPRV